MTMELEPADEDSPDDVGSWKSDSIENHSEFDDLDEEEIEDLCQTTTTPEFLQWREQVQAKLSLLEKSMDPLAARAQYNFESSPIYSAPDEILLMAMRYLDDEDKAAFFSLRKSRDARDVLLTAKYSGRIPFQDTTDVFSAIRAETNQAGNSVCPGPASRRRLENSTVAPLRSYAKLRHVSEETSSA
jgi:hypothetical protein